MTDRPGLTTAQVLHVLADEGVQVTPTTVRTWVRRGHLRRGADGLIDPRSLIEHLDARAARDAPERPQS